MEWVGLATANFITMAVLLGAQRMRTEDMDCGNEVDGGSQESCCNRTGFAIILAWMSGVAAVGMFLLRYNMMLQLAPVIISLVACWCFGANSVFFHICSRPRRQSRCSLLQFLDKPCYLALPCR